MCWELHSVDPLRDAVTLDLELMLSDLGLGPPIPQDAMHYRLGVYILVRERQLVADLTDGPDEVRGPLSLHAVGEPTKSSQLFIALLDELVRRYPHARCVHVILDNYVIHKSGVVAAALERLDARVALHFLPPYCPDHNRIERAWLELHANVTRNHRCKTLRELLANARTFILAYRWRAKHTPLLLQQVA